MEDWLASASPSHHTLFSPRVVRRKPHVLVAEDNPVCMHPAVCVSVLNACLFWCLLPYSLVLFHATLTFFVLSRACASLAYYMYDFVRVRDKEVTDPHNVCKSCLFSCARASHHGVTLSQHICWHQLMSLAYIRTYTSTYLGVYSMSRVEPQSASQYSVVVSHLLSIYTPLTFFSHLLSSCLGCLTNHTFISLQLTV